jgi:hypothetical protein
MHVEPVRARLVRPPGIAIETGVEMDVALDEAGHDERVVEIDRFSPGGGLVRRQQRGNPAVLDRDVTTLAAIEAGIEEGCVEAHRAARS